MLDAIDRLIAVAPRQAFEKTAQLRDRFLRQRMRRETFLAMAARTPRDAAAFLPSVIDEPWIPRVHFAQALDIAWYTVRGQPALSERFLRITAWRHPQYAVSQKPQYIDLPYGKEILAAAESSLKRPDAAAQLLRLGQNSDLAASLSPTEIIDLVAQATTEAEQLTALALLKRVAWSANFPPQSLRTVLAFAASNGTLGAIPESAARRALEGIESAEDPVAEAARSAAFLPFVDADVEDALPSGSLGATLRARRSFAAPLNVPSLFPNGLCLERYVFHNDDDGVESYDSFMAIYGRDTSWTIERNDNFVFLKSPVRNGRRIEIYANIPVDLQVPANQARAAEVNSRQEKVSKAIKARNLEPTVLIHRGHDHHFPNTKPLLPAGARLVYLGSCRGVAAVEDVITRCRRAQVIATRAIGATAVNDPFLYALNTQLLSASDALDWAEFWNSLRPKLQSNEHFAGYIRPDQNAEALFLAAWFRNALAAP